MNSKTRFFSSIIAVAILLSPGGLAAQNCPIKSDPYNDPMATFWFAEPSERQD